LNDLLAVMDDLDVPLETLTVQEARQRLTDQVNALYADQGLRVAPDRLAHAVARRVAEAPARLPGEGTDVNAREAHRQGLPSAIPPRALSIGQRMGLLLPFVTLSLLMGAFVFRSLDGGPDPRVEVGPVPAVHDALPSVLQPDEATRQHDLQRLPEVAGPMAWSTVQSLNGPHQQERAFSAPSRATCTALVDRLVAGMPREFVRVNGQGTPTLPGSTPAVALAQNHRVARAACQESRNTVTLDFHADPVSSAVPTGT
jgi:hypothetical protein